MLVSDRPGGRPDIGELPKVLGKAAAEANIAIYALHVDNTFVDETSARVSSHRCRPGRTLSRPGRHGPCALGFLGGLRRRSVSE